MKKLTYEEAIEILQKAKRLTGEQSEQINRLANAIFDGRWDPPIPHHHSSFN